jgi:hypothetical protein
MDPRHATLLLFPLLAPLAPLAVGAPRSDAEALARGLESVRADDLRSDLYFVASDELAGRDTPSPGLRIAARFLRARLQRLGFQPAGDDGFFDRYVLERAVLDEAGTRAWVERDGESSELLFGEDYAFRPDNVRALDLAAPVVFVGEARAEDLAGLALAGRWALAWGSPGPYRWRAARDRVRAAGAAGVLLAAPPGGEGDPYAELAPRLAGRASRGSLRAPDEESFPHAFLSLRAASPLLGGHADGAGPAVGEVLGSFHDRRALGAGSERHELENVCGLWPGADPELSKEVIVVSAHYDHVGEHDGEIFNGADDNGSGTCGLLELAEALRHYGPMRRSVLLLWVSGEEKGLKGSEAWTLAPTLPPGHQAVCNLNIDMIGRNAPDSLLITPTRERPEYNGIVRLAEEVAPLEGFPELGSCDEYWFRSDHMNFAQNLGIPVAFLFSDVHEDYHQPTDTADKIDYDKMRRVVRLVLRMLDGLQADELRLELAPEAGARVRPTGD